MAETPSLETFLGRVQAALAARGDATREIIRILASTIPEAARSIALGRIDAALAATEPEFVLEAFPGLEEDDPGREVAADVEGFVQRLESGHYFRGLLWDEERQQQRAFGDESWAREMDEHLGRAATVSFSGNDVLAAHLYARLLGVFRLESRPGVFCGPDRPSRMVDTDLAEAKRNYLRALYRVVPVDSRPRRLVSELIQLRDIGESELGLGDLHGTEAPTDEYGEAEPGLPDFAAFLRGAIQWIESVEREPGPVAREIRRLLREAVFLSDGADGLGALARREGGAHPEAWHDWFGALVRTSRFDDALKAGREGLLAVEDAGYKARLGDRMAALAVRVGDGALALEVARTAWRTRPNEVRLLQLAAAADVNNDRTRVLDREAGEVLRPTWTHGDALAARVLLLAGRVEEAIGRFQRADAMGWGRADHAGTIVLPYLLAAASGLDPVPTGSTLARLWDDLDAPARGYFDRRLLLDRFSTPDEASEIDGRGRSFSELLRQTSAANRPPDLHRARLLGLAQVKVESAVKDILASQHRRGQALAATLTVALAEAIHCVRGADVAESFLRTARRPHTKESPFRQALEGLRAQSPILLPPRSRGGGS